MTPSKSSPFRSDLENFCVLAEAIPHMVWVTDASGAAQFYNQRCLEFVGQPPDAILGWEWKNFIHGDDWERVVARWTDCLRSGSPYENEFRVLRADGQYRWLLSKALPHRNAKGVIVWWFGTLTDITPQLETESALRANESRFRALIEKSFDGVCLLTPEGVVTYITPSVTKTLGYSETESLGGSVFYGLHPDDLPAFRVAFERLLATPGLSIPLGYRVGHRDGSWRQVEAVWTNLLDDPNVGAILVNYRDVTERWQLEEKFRQSQKMDAIGRLAGGIAHDFNNLLTAINGYGATLSDRLRNAGEPALANLAKNICQAGEQAASLIRQLLAFSRKQTLAPHRFDVNVVIAETADLLRRLIGENIVVTLELCSGPAIIEADPVQIKQILLNLTLNARDAMPGGGSLVIGSRLVDEPASVEVSIADNGSGMSAEVQAHIFEPFFTTKEVGKGTGLGLSTVYGIVQQSGGQIEVESQPGQGTTFRIRFPQVDGDVIPTPTTRVEAPLAGGRETILLVEDEVIVRDMAKQILEEHGYTVLEAGKPEDALRTVREHAGAIDLLITDIVMPGGGGRRLSERVHELRPAIRILFISGYPDDELVRIGIRSESMHYLEKPFLPDDLIRATRFALDSVR